MVPYLERGAEGLLQEVLSRKEIFNYIPDACEE